MHLNKACKNSLIICRLLFKQPRQPLKNVSYLSVIRRTSVLDKSKHELIYEFPLIKFVGAFARSRYSVALVTVIVAPFILFFSTKSDALFFLLSGGIHYAVSAASAKFSENMVGKIYTNKEGDHQEVIISSIDRSGKRIDKSYNSDEFVNCDYYSRFSRCFGFVRLAIENSDIHYKINIKNCQVHNVEICNYLLGKLWTVETKKCAGYKR